MKSRLKAMLVPLAVSLASLPGEAMAVAPTTADCLAASEASTKSANEHRLRAERADLLICAAASCPVDIRKECLRGVEEVNSAIPTVIFDVKDGAGNDLSEVRVTMDGEVIANRLDGTALSLDPGAHTFVFEATGRPPEHKLLVIRVTEKDRKELITMAATATGAAASQGAGASQGGGASQGVGVSPVVRERLAPSATTGNSGVDAQRVLAVIAAGIGLGGVGVGTGFGLEALSKRDQARKACPAQCADSTDVNLWKAAATAGNISTIAFIVGAAGLGGGVVLWATGRSEPGGEGARLSLGPGTLTMSRPW